MEKIVCLGKNYIDHIRELNLNYNDSPKDYPTVFLKPPSTGIFLAPNVSKIIDLDFSDGDIHHEIELVFLVKKTFSNATIEEIPFKIEGYSLGIDFTKRDLQTKLKNEGLPWTLSKCFPNSAVILSPFRPLPQSEGTLLEEEFILEVNGEIKQRGLPKEMITSPFEAISRLSYKIPFVNGDIFFTGTPKGVGPVHKGDTIKFYFKNDEKNKGIIEIGSNVLLS